jgi:peptide deformylase
MEIREDLEFLRKKSKKVKEITDDIRNLVFEMGKTMEENNGLGLAAPQVGVLERLFVVKDQDGFTAFINPVILKKSKEKDFLEEGCLSVPGCRLMIKRPVKIKVKALNIEGQEVVLDLDGLAAKVFQHETDHLDGILIIDRISLKEKIKKLFK